MALTLETVRQLVEKYRSQWPGDPLWVALAAPGDDLNIPGVTFGQRNARHAGMELPIRAHLIVPNAAMLPDSLFSTFLHELGHAYYRVAHPNDFNEVDAEVEAVIYSLRSLDAEGMGELARREAKAIKEMASREPYKSAVQKMAASEIWNRYGEL